MEEKGSFKPQQRLKRSRPAITVSICWCIVLYLTHHCHPIPGWNLGKFIMPPHDQPFTLEVPLKLTRQGTCARRKMKIVVIRQQLGLLLSNSKQFKLKGIAAGFSESFKVGDRKWQPSLVTIPEVQKF